MKVVLINSYSCCHCDEFFGVFSSEDIAKKAIIDKENRKYGKLLYQKDIKYWLELDDTYQEYVICKGYTHIPSDKYIVERDSFFYRIADLEIDDI